MLTLLIFIQLANANPTLILTVTTSKETYYIGEEVKINGTLTADGSPVPDAAVAIQVNNKTSGETYLLRSRPTSTNYTGKYPVEITEAYLSDQWGTPKSSVKQGDIAYFRVKVRNNEETTQYVTLLPYFQMSSTPLPIEISPAFQGQILYGIAYNQTFGKPHQGTSMDIIMEGNKKFASCFELAISSAYHANVTKISWWGFSNQSVAAKAILYNSNTTDGSPLQLVATSQETILSTTTKWWNFTFNPSVILQGGYYWLGLIANAPAKLYFTYDPAFVSDHNVSAFAYNNDLYSDGPTNPFGKPTYQNASMSIYATYTLIQDYGIDAIFTRYIPDKTPIGTATIYINALRQPYPSCLPKNGGTAHCPDKAANFTITSKSGAGASKLLYQAESQITETLSSPSGYYELRFKSTRGNFTAYTSCYYQGETATNSVTFRVKLQGDVNDDGKVEGKDVGLISKAYNTKPGDPLWDPRADLNNDGVVEGKDVGIVSKYYGTSA